MLNSASNMKHPINRRTRKFGKRSYGLFLQNAARNYEVRTKISFALHQKVACPEFQTSHLGWNRKEIMFVSEHEPFPLYLFRLNLRTCVNCSCGGKGRPIHYATKCSLILSRHFLAPTLQNKLQWFQRHPHK
ncbi:hypothetical protein AVEN_209393-1 [Araneus ventricosus]|uniref:Uncharacterized protein n=1 Tax=Araneus ventricosus TaxID=182803 RepID=A0A4Y2PPK0_ARAVE|nr:hypothetical protein AVEN_209393-1 [Araneus ventricosus]